MITKGLKGHLDRNMDDPVPMGSTARAVVEPTQAPLATLGVVTWAENVFDGVVALA